MNYPTPYGQAEELALENERLTKALREAKDIIRQDWVSIVQDAERIREGVDKWEADGDDESLVNDYIDPWIKTIIGLRD